MSVTQLFPWSIWDCWWLAPLALILDLILGDPRLPWPHPVCFIGKALNKSAHFIQLHNSSFPQNKNLFEKISGVAVLLLLGSAIFFIVLLLVSIPYAGILFAIYFSWAGMAMGCLLDTGKLVLNRIETGNLQDAREGTSWLVSRDVSNLDKSMLAKTLADTLSENYTDAFFAPFIYLIFFGPAGLWFYKTASTMDSQWGYMTPKWKYTGWAGAKADDMLAWIPARVSALAFYLANICWNLDSHTHWPGKWPGFAKIAQDAKGMTSPNSGWSMAACAWLLNCKMAGPSIYFGQLVKKEWLGPKDGNLWNGTRLNILCQLLLAATITGAFIVWLFALIIKELWHFLCC